VLTKLKILLCVAAFALIGSVSSAEWRSNGPYAGVRAPLFFHPLNPNFIITQNFRSIDGGQSWQTTHLPFALLFKIHPQIPNEILAISDRGANFQLLFSRDQGLTWNERSKYDSGSNSIGGGAGDFEMDPSNRLILYVTIISAPIVKSVDGGLTWKKINRNMDRASDYLSQIEIDPTNPKIIYFLMRDGTFYRSTNAGENWIKLGSGLRLREAFALQIHPKDPKILYAGGIGGIYKTADSGRNWTNLKCECIPNPRGISIDPKHPSTIYVAGQHRAIRSIDNGVTWTQSPLPERSVDFGSTASADPHHNNTVFLATPNGLYKSQNSGFSWKLSNKGIFTRTGVLALSPAKPQTVFASNGALLFRSNNLARNWNQNLIANQNEYELFSHLAVHAKKPNLVFAGGHGLYLSKNSGKAWIKKLAGDWSINCIALDPVNENTLYIATSDGFLKSIDQGNNWVRKKSFDAISIAVSPSNPAILFAGTFDGKIYKSIDGGNRWSNVTHGLKILFGIKAIAIDSTNPNIIYFGGFNNRSGPWGVFKSTDGANTWQFKGAELSLQGLDGLIMNPGNSSQIYVFNSREIYVSENGAESWQKLDLTGLGNNGILGTNQGILDLAISPDPFTLLAGTLSGVYFLPINP
jgi:photosystem II stability/assembly factor-like uncharacterized protein